MELDVLIVWVEATEVDVGVVDGVLDEEEEAPAAVPGAVAPDNGEALKTRVAGRWVEFSLLYRGDNDVVFLEKVVDFRRRRPNAVGVELENFGAWRMMRATTRRTRVWMYGSTDEEKSED